MQKVRIRAIAEGAVMVALAWALSYIELDLWFQGGSIGFTMIPIVIYAVRWGMGWGVCAGAVLGAVKFFFAGGFAIGWQSIVLDYLLAYSTIGFAGFFKGRKLGMVFGAVVAGISMFCVHYISGIVLYAEYMPDIFMGLEMTSPYFYSALYNGGYMLPNTIIAAIAGFFLSKPLERFPTGTENHN